MSTTSAGSVTTAPSSSDGFVDVPHGLSKVVVTETALGDVRGDEGFFHYREYSAVDLAEQVSFEEAAHLLVVGHLPDGDELDHFRAELGRRRPLPPRLAALLPEISRTTSDSLQVLRTALSAWGGIADLRPLYDAGEQERHEAALTAIAVTPTILAAAHRLQRGLEPVAADPSLPHAVDYLRMVTGEMPKAHGAGAVESYLVATMDHGFNASTFTARVIASTGADLAACLVGALGSFSGPRHGGAPSRALEALDEIGSLDRAPAWVRQRVEAGDRIMGFGHAVYRTHDPRSELLKGLAQGGTTRSSTWPSGSRPPSSRPWPSSSPAVSCMPTSSSMRVS